MSWHIWADRTDLTAAPYKVLNFTPGIPQEVAVFKAGKAAGASLETYRGDQHLPVVQKLRIVVESTISADDALTQADELALILRRAEVLRLRRTDTSPLLEIDVRSVILGDPKPLDQPQLEGAFQARFDANVTTGPYWLGEEEDIPQSYIVNGAMRYGASTPDLWSIGDSMTGTIVDQFEDYNLFGVRSWATKYTGVAGDSADSWSFLQNSPTTWDRLKFKGGDPITAVIWFQGSFQGCNMFTRVLTIDSLGAGVDNITTSLDATNRFVNPSFEDQYGILGPSKVAPGYGWATAETTSSAPLYSFIEGRKRDDKREGGQAVQLVHQHQAADVDGAVWIEQEVYGDDIASADVTLSTYLANFIHTGAVLKHDVTFKDASGSTLSNPTNTITASASATSLDDDDARVQSTFTAPANAVKALGRLIIEDLDADEAAQIDFDDFQLEVASTATEFKEWEKVSSTVPTAGVDVEKAQTGALINSVDEDDDFHVVVGGLALFRSATAHDFTETRVTAAPGMYEVDGVKGQVDALTKLRLIPLDNTTETLMIGGMSTAKFGPTSRAMPLLFFDDNTAAQTRTGARTNLNAETHSSGGPTTGGLWDVLAQHGTLSDRFLLLARVSIEDASETWQVRFRNYFVIGADQIAVNGEWVPNIDNQAWEVIALGVAELPPVSYGGSSALTGDNLAITIQFQPVSTGTLAFDTLTAIPVGQGAVIAGGPSEYATEEGIEIVDFSPLPRERDVRKYDGTIGGVSVLDQTQELGRLLLAPGGNVLCAYFEQNPAANPGDTMIEGSIRPRYIIPAAAG